MGIERAASNGARFVLAIAIACRFFDRLIDHLERAALSSGFLVPERPGRFVLRMRRLFARAGIEREEVNILRGLLSAFEGNPRKP